MLMCDKPCGRGSPGGGGGMLNVKFMMFLFKIALTNPMFQGRGLRI